LTVQPAINLEAGYVILTIRPTISRVTNVKQDPAVSIIAGNINNNKANAAVNNTLSNSICSEIPIVEIRELDSVIKVRSGQGIVMGGLMQENTNRKNFGMPGTSNIPIIGDITRGRSRSSEVTELVILLRVHIIPQDGLNIDAADSRLFKSCSDDPRPIETIRNQ
jgi:general secretion pathway protein D